MILSRRTAFTLVELLVVISIIGVLASLTLPAVQSVRESGRRTVCLRSQQQLGVASQSYEGLDPSGRLVGYHNKLGTGVNPVVTWPIRLFAHFEQKTQQDSWRDNPGAGTTLFVKTLICPSDVKKDKTGPALSYVINAGMAAGGTEAPANGVAHDYYNTGVATCDADFVDGRAQTLLFSENAQTTYWNVLPGAAKQHGVFVWFPNGAPSAEHLINGNKKLAVLGPNTARPASFHPGGVVVTFAGGNARYMRENIDYFVYQRLMTPNDNKSNIPGTRPLAPLSSTQYE